MQRAPTLGFRTRGPKSGKKWWEMSCHFAARPAFPRVCWRCSTELASATRSAPLRAQASGTPQHQRRDPKQHKHHDPKPDHRQFGWPVHQNPRWKNHARVVAARPLLCALNTHWEGAGRRRRVEMAGSERALTPGDVAAGRKMANLSGDAQ